MCCCGCVVIHNWFRFLIINYSISGSPPCELILLTDKEVEASLDELEKEEWASSMCVFPKGTPVKAKDPVRAPAGVVKPERSKGGKYSSI